jgi:hypothetical protein
MFFLVLVEVQSPWRRQQSEVLVAYPDNTISEGALAAPLKAASGGAPGPSSARPEA